MQEGQVRIKVRALKRGIKGYDGLGNPIEIPPGMHRWMDPEDAEAAVSRGDVQLLSGLDSASLKEPNYEDRALESPAATDRGRQEDAQNEEVKKRRGRPRKDSTYRRRDMTAEKPGS